MSDEWYKECSVVAYPREIRFLNIDGSAINYHVDRQVSLYIQRLQMKIEDLENKNREKDIEKLQLQSNWNSLREYCKEYADKDTMSSIIFGVVLDKMNELEGDDKVE